MDDTGSWQEQLWQKYGVLCPGHIITSRVTNFILLHCWCCRKDNEQYVFQLLKAHKARASKKARKNIVNMEVTVFKSFRSHC